MYLNRYFPQRTTIVSSNWLAERNFRLDPTRYNERGERVARHLQSLPFRKTTIGNWDAVEYVTLPTRFGRTYIKSEENGIPFLGSSSMLALRLPKDVLLAPGTKKLQEVMVKSGELLLSRSGTIGEVVLCGETYKGFAVSEHAIRILANEDIRGYLYAYLASPLGRELVLQQNYGKVIKEISVDQVKNIPVPIVRDEVFKDINGKVLEIVTLYDKARRYLQLADEEIQQAVGLSGVRRNDNLWLHTQNKTYLKDSLDLFNYRLDPHFYEPDINLLRERLVNTPHKSLGEIANVWMPNRFARQRADKGHGTFFYSSAEMMRARRITNSIVSNRAEKFLKQCKVKKGMTLICRSGAFGGIMGRATFVSNAADGWAVTEDMVRCETHDPNYPPEYVFAMLGSLSIGYPLITAYRYGKDVPHIDPAELKKFPIPILDDKKRNKIAATVGVAFESLDKANSLEETVQGILLEELEWSTDMSSDLPFVPGDMENQLNEE